MPGVFFGGLHPSIDSYAAASIALGAEVSSLLPRGCKRKRNYLDQVCKIWDHYDPSKDQFYTLFRLASFPASHKEKCMLRIFAIIEHTFNSMH